MTRIFLTISSALTTMISITNACFLTSENEEREKLISIKNKISNGILNLIMKKWLCFFLLMLSGYTSTSQAVNQSLNFSIRHAAAYYASITNLREAISYSLPGLSGVTRITRDDDSLTLLRLTDVPDTNVTLVIQNRNLYTIGFIVSLNNTERFYRFNDMGMVSIPGITAANTVTLNLGSDYGSLEGRAERGRSSLRATTIDIEGAVRTLHNHHVATRGSVVTAPTATALLTLVVSISEAARFPEISTWVADSIVRGYEANVLGIHRSAITNQWSSVSQFARAASESSTPLTYRNQVWDRLITVHELSQILIVGLCGRTSSARLSRSLNVDGECDAGWDNVLIGNQMVELRTLMATID